MPEVRLGAATFFTAVLAAGLVVPLPLSSCSRKRWDKGGQGEQAELGADGARAR